MYALAMYYTTKASYTDGEKLFNSTLTEYEYRIAKGLSHLNIK
ncbi:hypothetical protein C8P68_1151 [Mucilaginibacter yixingensis]|uniref:Uncharacterized protein n=1 Tax=Mucilaginibacter yixingensis TaxID=1295612 RepID=A0A2T5J4I4_9SPHI|nr:hypothetical protein C8P68_1151 [Mucilaginibacter yixingensis]